MEAVASNTFYVRTRRLRSGRHISRLTLRAAFNGYQYHRVERQDHVVHPGNYLVVNQGQTYCSEIEADHPLEALVVAFRPGVLAEVYAGLRHSTDYLLDNPYEEAGASVTFFEHAYPGSKGVRRVIEDLRRVMLSGGEEAWYFEERYYELLHLMLLNHEASLRRVDQLPPRKPSTRMELFRRLGLARDFMEAHLGESLDLATVSREAALSPYHFLRVFKSAFGLTPHQFVSRERLRYAGYLLRNTDRAVKQVCAASGFENLSAFTRRFRQHYGLSPSAFRKGLKL